MAADYTVTFDSYLDPPVPSTVLFTFGDFATVIDFESISDKLPDSSSGGGGGSTRPTSGFLYPRGQG